MEKNNRPKVGVGVLILKNDKVLFGLRKGSHGPNSWCPPGGHLEYNEEPEKCAIRETLEECGVKIKNIRRGPYTNDMFDTGKHYITLCMIADWESGEPAILEPEKCEKWGWFEWDNLPEPLFLPTINLLKHGFNPFNK